jgi:hypothetical protein
MGRGGKGKKDAWRSLWGWFKSCLRRVLKERRVVFDWESDDPECVWRKARHTTELRVSEEAKGDMLLPPGLEYTLIMMRPLGATQQANVILLCLDWSCGWVYWLERLSAPRSRTMYILRYVTNRMHDVALDMLELEEAGRPYATT